MYQPVSDLEYFESLVADADSIPLFEAASALAHIDDPEVSLDAAQHRLDNLSDRLFGQSRDATTELERLEAVTRFFYREMQFAGNRNDYYDPRNSFIHHVLDTRRGIPISLAVIFTELAESIGLTVHGVSFPGHFLVRIDLHNGTIVLDPFTGDSLSREDVDERVDPFRQSMIHAGARELPTQAFLQPASPADILMRMLRNLQQIYQQRDMPNHLQRVQARMQLLQRAVSSRPDQAAGDR